MPTQEHNPYSAPVAFDSDTHRTIRIGLVLLLIVLALRLVASLAMPISITVFGSNTVNKLFKTEFIYLLYLCPAFAHLMALLLIWRGAPRNARRISMITVFAWMTSVGGSVLGARFFTPAVFATAAQMMSGGFAMIQTYCLMSLSTQESTKKWGKLLIGTQAVRALALLIHWEFSRSQTPFVIAGFFITVAMSGMTCWLLWRVIHEYDEAMSKQA